MRLARVADEFRIDGRPILSDTVRRGAIEYDERRDRFTIYLSAAGARIGLRKQRFVYAHEFSHRFLFVPGQGGWVRALGKVVEEAESGRRLATTRVLSGIEERICNGVAGRVLVPEECLAEALGEVVRVGRAPVTLEDFGAYVSRTFEVSWWAAVRRLIVTRPEPVVDALGRSYVFLLVGRSRHTGRGNGDRAWRVLDGWWPREIGGKRIVEGYPGLRVAHLGRDLEGFVDRASPGQSRELVCGLRLLSRRGELICGTLKGAWRFWGGEGEARVLVHGRIG